MIFEFDEKKNESNIEKHKVSFEEVKAIWQDPDLMVVSARKRGEKRQMAIGRAYAVMFSVVHTKRGEAVRIISARRSTRRCSSMSKTRTIDKLEAAFDAGEDMEEFFDFDSPTFPNKELKRVNVDFPQWMVAGLDAEASRLGINRQAVIKTWVAEKLDARASA